MRRQDFSYNLPDELIAYQPAPERTGSRLLCLDGPTGSVRHQQFQDLLAELSDGDVMVFNNTKVIPARLYAQKETGGKVEILVERVLDEQSCLAHVRASKSPKPGAKLLLENGEAVEVTGRQEALFQLSFQQPLLPILDAVGHIPLPPYIEREDTLEDQTRYQTVFGSETGAVAAPTAGLHFDEPMMDAIKAKGVKVLYVTLHVGAGTFQPVRVDDIAEHEMHSEWMAVDQATCDVINEAKKTGQRIVAVGTTSVRSLESAAQKSNSDELAPYQGDTNIFITPGYQFKVVDALVTNFHLSESTLMMLVSAFGGYRHIMQAYQQAIEERYRFFSYGDAMFITRDPNAPSEKIDREAL